ncbi:MAG: TatD family hydrolase [Schleiferiaceae bacterium]|jgi:TatD DNase family protein|nr:TatD family hydrolase [Schleiferiaceae bacterium]MDR9441772.1 TatD family hydrolase [Schleiferiaceae bacterium]
MIDTHTHLYLPQFTDDRPEMLARARAEGVEAFYLPNIDKDSIPAVKELAQAEADCFPMMGLHPSHVKDDYQEHLAAVFEELAGPQRYYAVGEIGVDLYWDKTFREEQMRVFGIQIEKAKEMGLPIVIHCRDAFEEVFEVLETFADERLYGIFHCFSGNLDQAQQAIGLNLKLGIGGIVTFKNAGLDQVVQQLGLENLVLETDAPYLAPAPYRGKRNESAYLSYIARRIADLHQRPLEEVVAITTANARQIFPA